jgi:hypothetical protein
MGFNQPTMWMRRGYVTDVVTLIYDPPKPNPQIDGTSLQLLLPTTAISPPPTQTTPGSFTVTQVVPPLNPVGSHEFRVEFRGLPVAWYVPFVLCRQVTVPIKFDGATEDPGIVKLNADPPQVMWGNPALYPLSVDGSFKFFPEPEDCKAKGIDFNKFDPRDLEFFSLDLQQVLPLNPKGALELPKGARLPSDLATRPFLVEVRVHDRKQKTTVTGTVPFQLHAGTDLIVMFDRSRSMSQANPKTQAPKWAAARDAASLLAEIYGGALSGLKTPAGVRLLDEQRIAFGHFDMQKQCPRTIIAPFRPASADKPLLTEDLGSHSGGAALGDALVSAQQFFGEGSRRRRRHIVVLTDSTDVGAARPLAELGPHDLPRTGDDVERGVTLHHIVYGQPGEAQSADLAALSRAYGGSFQDSSCDIDPLDPGDLHEMFLSVLADVLPIERFDTRGSSCVPIEDGTRRAIFVATDSRDLSVSFGGKRVPDELRRTSGAFTFITVDQPAAGQWDVSGARHDARVVVLLESALRMRCGVSLRAQGEAITVWAELAQGMFPVRNADLRASVYRPGESIGELLTSFAQSGELISACRARHVEPRLTEPGGPLLSTARALLVVTPQRKDRLSLRPDGDDELGAEQDEPRAPQRILLDAVERARDLPFQSQRQSLRLTEVRPGRYEAQLPASDAQHEGTYTFRLRALGCTPDGYAFARDQRTSISIAPIPDAKHSAAWIEQVGKASADGSRSWVATVQPRTRLGKPLGPGLIRNLRIEYADQDDGKRLRALRTHDNFDGTYSARFEIPAGAHAPALALRYRLAGAGTVATVPLRGRVTAGKRVRVILNELRIRGGQDRCLLPDPASKHGQLLKFDVVAAINGNPNRAARKHVKTTVPSGQAGSCGIELSELVFDGQLEPGAALDIAIGETDFDWMKLLAGDPAELRYRQVFRVVDHAQGWSAVPLFEQPDQPGRVQNAWKVWLTVHVE